MREVGSMIAQVLRDMGSEENLAAVRRRVAALTEKFPLYAWKLNAVGV
jgi:glycine/serine hydroxymethyltransferase